jgi:hypothetical protein
VFVLGRRHTESLEQMQLLFGGPDQALEFLAARSGLALNSYRVRE